MNTNCDTGRLLGEPNKILLGIPAVTLVLAAHVLPGTETRENTQWLLTQISMFTFYFKA